MERKLVKQGQNALTVTLPAKWLKQNHLSQGDEVHINQLQEGILVSTNKEPPKKETIISLKEETEQMIRIHINNLYRTGYDKITIKEIKHSTQKKLIKVVEKSLLGFEVTEQKDTEITIENVAEPSEDKFDTLFKRMFYTLSQSLEEVSEMISKKQFNLEELENKTWKMGLYDNFCRRKVSKKKLTKESPELLWSTSKKLLLLQRGILHLLKKSKHSILKANQIQELKKDFDLMTLAFFKKDNQTLIKIANKLNKDWESSFESKSPNNSFNYFITQALRETGLLGYGLIGIVLASNSQKDLHKN